MPIAEPTRKRRKIPPEQKSGIFPVNAELAPDRQDTVLATMGYRGSIEDVNRRLQVVTDAHERQFGTRPSPGLALDLVRSPITDDNLPDLFWEQGTKYRRQAGIASAELGIPPDELEDTDSTSTRAGLLVEGEKKAGAADSVLEVQKYLGTAETPKDRQGLFMGLLFGEMNAEEERKAAKLAQKEAEAGAEGRALQVVSTGGLGETALNTPMRNAYEDWVASLSVEEARGLQQQHDRTFAMVLAISEYPDVAEIARGSGGLAVLGMQQIIHSLAMSPFGLAEVVKTEAHDINRARKGDFSFKENRRLGRAIGAGFKETYENPFENPGFIAMDFFGLVTGGAGGVARFGAATRGAKLSRTLKKGGEITGREFEQLRPSVQGNVLEGNTFKAVAWALARRPLPGTFTLKKGDMEVEVLLSGNAALRAAQRRILGRKQAGVTRRHEGEGPFGFSYPGRGVAESFFSVETKIGRELQAAKRVDYTISMALVNELRKVAGWSRTSSKFWTAYREKTGWTPIKPGQHKGLTRGENAALFAMSIDDPTPISTLLAFHGNLAENPKWWFSDKTIKNHQEKVADYKMALVAMQNPSPRFTRTLELVREVIEEQEAMKVIVGGLSPITATTRVARAGMFVRGEKLPASIQDLSKRLDKMEAGGAGEAELVATRGKLDTAIREYGEIERASEKSFYMPFQLTSKPKAKGKGAQAAPAAQFGGLGIPPPRTPSELRHEFTGRAIEVGNYRLDAANLAADAYGRAVRYLSVKNEYDALVKASVATEAAAGQYAVPIRLKEGVEDRLREIMNKTDSGEFDAKEALALSETDLNKLHKQLFPEKDDLSADEMKNIVWVDSRLVDQRHLYERGGSGRIGKIGGAVNSVFVGTTLYARPAYMLNFLGNGSMAFWEQGVFAPGNFGRAVAMSKGLYSERTRYAIDSAIGQGRSMSYINERTARVVRKAGETWSVATDLYWRRSALIHEARKLGYKTPQDMERLMFSDDPLVTRHRVESVRRANKSMVEFDNLTHMERNVLRHVVFVYPWMSRSLVWSFRAIAEHPIKADALVHLADVAEQDEEWQKVLGRAPEWFKRSGYFPVAWRGGNPLVVNPSSVNTFSILQEYSNIVRGFGSDDDSGSLSEVLGPVAGTLVRMVTKKNQYGDTYDHGSWGALADTVTNLPQVRAWDRLEKLRETRSNVEDKATEAADRSPLMLSMDAVWGPLVTAGLWPREVDREALEARYWKEQNHLSRARLEASENWKAARYQQTLLGMTMPEDAKAELRLANEEAVRNGALHDELGKEPSTPDRYALRIALFQEKGIITDAQASELQKMLKKAGADPEDLEVVSREIGRAADLGAWSDWKSRATIVESFDTIALAKDLDWLRTSGISRGPYEPGDLKSRLEYGRKYLEFEEEENRQVERAFNSIGPERQVAFAEYSEWLETQDHSVTTKGGRFPSVVRMMWARTSPGERERDLFTKAQQPWEFMSSFDKQLLGKSETPRLAAAWNSFTTSMTDALQARAPGDRSPAQLAQVKRKYAQSLNALYPDFYQDYLFSERPLYQRLQVLEVYTKSTQKESWAELFGQANQFWMEMQKDGVSKTAIRDYWSDQVGTRRKPGPYLTWIAGRPSLQQEVDLFLDSNSDFLLDLIG